MRLSPAFDNTAPASVTPSRGGSWASPDNAPPATKFQSYIQWYVAGAAAFSPSNDVAVQLRNGLVLGNDPENGTRFFNGTGSFFSVPDGRLYSIAITPQTTYPLLLATAGGFSFYATNAGVTNNALTFGTSTLRINGSAFITGPNGYSARGSFQWFANNNPEESGIAPGDPTYLEVWADETGLSAQATNTAPALTFNIKTQLRNGNAFPDDLPATGFTSRVRVLFNAVPSHYPAGSNYLTATGFTLPSGSGSALTQLRSGTFLTAFAANGPATVYSVILDGQHKFPLLLCTAAGYSFYATNAGGFRGGLQPNGSCLVTGPNGYNAIGTFNYLLQGDNGTSYLGNCELYVYVNEANRLLAQPTNTAPEARQ